MSLIVYDNGVMFADNLVLDDYVEYRKDKLITSNGITLGILGVLPSTRRIQQICDIYRSKFDEYNNDLTLDAPEFIGTLVDKDTAWIISDGISTWYSVNNSHFSEVPKNGLVCVGSGSSLFNFWHALTGDVAKSFMHTKASKTSVGNLAQSINVSTYEVSRYDIS